MDTPEKSTTQVVRDGLEKACREFTERITPLGFARTKKMFWTREHQHTVDFIHFHRSGSSYGAPRNFSVGIRVHFGIRVLNDTFEAAALNGPFSDSALTRAGNFHLRFNAKTGSTYDRCVDDLVRFVVEQGEPWFMRFRDPSVLGDTRVTPLRLDSLEALDAALRGNADAANVAKSQKILGIKPTKQQNAEQADAGNRRSAGA
ncbi:MAG: hypothetical protein QM680_07190 [Luteolibacter sp.]